MPRRAPPNAIFALGCAVVVALLAAAPPTARAAEAAHLSDSQNVMLGQLEYYERQFGERSEESAGTYCYHNAVGPRDAPIAQTIVYIYEEKIMLRQYQGEDDEWYENVNRLNSKKADLAADALAIPDVLELCRRRVETDGAYLFRRPSASNMGFVCGKGDPSTPSFQGWNVLSVSFPPDQCSMAQVIAKPVTLEHQPSASKVSCDAGGPFLRDRCARVVGATTVAPVKEKSVVPVFSALDSSLKVAELEFTKIPHELRGHILSINDPIPPVTGDIAGMLTGEMTLRVLDSSGRPKSVELADPFVIRFFLEDEVPFELNDVRLIVQAPRRRVTPSRIYKTSTAHYAQGGIAVLPATVHLESTHKREAVNIHDRIRAKQNQDSAEDGNSFVWIGVLLMIVVVAAVVFFVTRRKSGRREVHLPYS